LDYAKNVLVTVMIDGEFCLKIGAVHGPEPRFGHPA